MTDRLLLRLSLLRTSRTMQNLLDSFLPVNRAMLLSPGRPLSASCWTRLTATATNLRRLAAPRCAWLTDALLRPVLRANQRLEQVDLGHCPAPTEAVLQLLTVQCPRLTHLRSPIL